MRKSARRKCGLPDAHGVGPPAACRQSGYSRTRRPVPQTGAPHVPTPTDPNTHRIAAPAPAGRDAAEGQRRVARRGPMTSRRILEGTFPLGFRAPHPGPASRQFPARAALCPSSRPPACGGNALSRGERPHPRSAASVGPLDLTQLGLERTSRCGRLWPLPAPAHASGRSSPDSTLLENCLHIRRLALS